MIKYELREIMENFTVGENGQVSAEFTFSEKFSGFSGHFPGNPILPGVCQIQSVLIVAAAVYRKDVTLIALSRAKFLNKVIPGDTIILRGETDISDGLISAKFMISKKSSEGKIRVSRISLKAESA